MSARRPAATDESIAVGMPHNILDHRAGLNNGLQPVTGDLHGRCCMHAARAHRLPRRADSDAVRRDAGHRAGRRISLSGGAEEGRHGKRGLAIRLCVRVSVPDRRSNGARPAGQ